MMNIGGVAKMIQRGRGSIHRNNNHVNHASGSSNSSGSGSSSYDDSSSEYDSCSSSHDSKNSSGHATSLEVTTRKPTNGRPRFPSPTASSSSSPFSNNTIDNEAINGDDDDVDPIIEPCQNSNSNNNDITSSCSSSNIIASSILSSIAAATAMLRQRRHPGSFVSQQQQQQRPPPHGNEEYRRTNTISKNHHINKNSMNSHHQHYQHQHKYCHNDHRSGVSEQQRRNNPNMKRRFCCDTGFWNDIVHDNLPCRRIFPQSTSLRSKNNKNNDHKNTNRTKMTKRKRKSYPTTIHTLATYILGICMLTWFVMLIWSFMNYIPSSSTTATTTMLDNDDALQHLPLHERASIRRSRLIDQHRRNHKSSHNWFVQFGLWINSFLFGDAPSNVPSTLPKNDAYKNVDSEELPKECQRAEWQSKNYPTCNDIYEIDLPNMIRIAPRKYYRETGRLYRSNDSVLDVNGTVHQEPEDISSTTNLNMGYVAQGYWRSVWAVHPPRNEIIIRNNNSLVVEPNVVVLKTLRRSHDLSTRNYDRHRRDAIVMEQLTSSPYVMNIYGFCGNSVLTEYMDLTLEDIAFDETQYPIINTDSGEDIVVTSTKRIQLALEMVRGVQAIHEIRGGPIVHADLQAKQFLISRSTGTVKINDFNRCRFMASKHINSTKYDGMNMDMDSTSNDSIITTTTLPCKFRIPSSPGVSRSPEEYMDNELDEKLDVYALGHVLYNLLSYREPWDGYHTVTAQQRMMNGEIPNMDQYIPNHDSNQSSPIHALSDLPVYIQKWYINITKRAYTFDPNERSSAAELALELETMLAEIKGLPSK